MRDPREIATRFEAPGVCRATIPFHRGHIHETFVAEFDEGRVVRRYLLQKINRHVFKQPDLLLSNIQRVTARLRDGWRRIDPANADRRTLTLVPGRDGAQRVIDEEGEYWRMYSFIEGTRSHDVAATPQVAEEAARAFGTFQAMLADLPGEPLHETIPGFHDTPLRFANFRRAVEVDRCNRARDAKAEIETALRLDFLAGALDRMDARSTTVHNDTKLNNVLFDEAGGHALCVVDLDTVMPGRALHDFGDMVRAAIGPAAEDERDLSKVVLRRPIFQALCRGYLAAAGDLISEPERDALPLAAEVMTLEVGLRFLTDYLEGDVYFRTQRAAHNLDRCRTQFRLVELMLVEHDDWTRIARNSP